ncbi:MAG TPA: hypothetical protein DDW52_02450 [Planctomycetaceae bacterium]|nr:hypothetical protein [Planctomycetaceae bacterium]
MKEPSTESPFLPATESRLQFGIVLYILLSVVFAGVALLLALAFQVPSIRDEVMAWTGWTPPQTGSIEESRSAQLRFLLALYALPVAFGGIVGLAHAGISWLLRWQAKHQRSADRGFEMD